MSTNMRWLGNLCGCEENTDTSPHVSQKLKRIRFLGTFCCVVSIIAAMCVYFLLQSGANPTAVFLCVTSIVFTVILGTFCVVFSTAAIRRLASKPLRDFENSLPSYESVVGSSEKDVLPPPSYKDAVSNLEQVQK